MTKFRIKLTLVFILFMTIAVIGLGLFSAHNMKQNHIETLKESLQREIMLISATVPWHTELPLEQRIAYFEQQAAYLRPFTESRITFIDRDGVVLGDSDHDARQMDNHLDREEIQAALTGDGTGFSIRYSDTVDRNILNVAMAVEENGERVGFIRLGMSLAQVESSIRSLWSYYLAGMLLLFLLAVLFGYRISISLTRPLESITQVAEQITHARYDSRVQIRSRDEIGKLGKAINKMAASLQNQMKRIADNETRLNTVLENLVSGVIMIDREGKLALANCTAERILGLSQKSIGHHYADARLEHVNLVALIDECVRTKEPIRDEMTLYYPEERTLEVNLVPLKKKDEEWGGLVLVLHDITNIRRLERMRSEFVANVSHELKTPVASVKGFAETLLNGALEDRETARSFVQIIYDESERLNRLIIDLLELSKIESKQAPLQLSPLEMHSFVTGTVRMLHKEAQKKNISFELKLIPGLYVEGDEDRLRQVLINLLSNAINYTPEGGKVTVEVKTLHPEKDPAEDKVVIMISDTGIGIPKKDLPRIFERFYRVDKARSRRSGGTGLGLSIVKHIVELHRGVISVESEVGVGTTFTIELPVIQQHPIGGGDLNASGNSDH